MQLAQLEREQVALTARVTDEQAAVVSMAATLASVRSAVAAERAANACLASQLQSI